MVKVIGQRLNQMTPCTRHMAYTARATPDYPHCEVKLGSFGAYVTDRHRQHR